MHLKLIKITMRNLFKKLTFSRNLVIHKKLRLLPHVYRGGGGSLHLALTKSLSRDKSFHFNSVTERHYSDRKYVLGIESSCDDTGAAVVDDTGKIIGEALNSQMNIHIEKYGGIHPSMARDLHRDNVHGIVTQALANAKMSIQEMDAIAVTIKPGLLLCLYEGLNYAKLIALNSGKPLIPIHHMQAHALTARMLQRIDFPFMVMLASGGHCLLAVARDIDDYLLIGRGKDCAPGDALDKVARQLHLHKFPECQGLSGGAAIEKLALNGDLKAFSLPHARIDGASCNFTFSYMEDVTKRLLLAEKKRLGLEAGDRLPSSTVADMCASVQYNLTWQLVRNLQRAFLFCSGKKDVPECRNMVLSGGVASNSFIRRNIERVCKDNNCTLICPPPKLCTDNGVMIAWNGMEKLLQRKDLDIDPASITPQARCPLGMDISDEVPKTTIKLRRVKFNIS